LITYGRTAARTVHPAHSPTFNRRSLARLP
jgi:hypothetical protein